MPTTTRTAAVLLTTSLAAVVITLTPQDPKPGYDDTPRLPGGEWRVHDKTRPRPAVVDPGTAGSPPSDAVILFDGKNLTAWRGEKGDAAWKIVDNSLEVNGSGSISTHAEFGDCQLHLEWMAPVKVEGESQGRGNSGVFLMGLYEIQILDSFDNPTYADGQAAAIYGQRPPSVNACRKPGEWQTFDILFRAPRFDAAKLVNPAVITVLHNGVAVHHAEPILGATAHRTLAQYSPHAPKAPLTLQDHGNPVRFRNIWIRSL